MKPFEAGERLAQTHIDQLGQLKESSKTAILDFLSIGALTFVTLTAFERKLAIKMLIELEEGSPDNG